MYALGFDIGGTKCACVLGNITENDCTIIAKNVVRTNDYGSSTALLEKLFYEAEILLAEENVLLSDLCGIGISCGGPLDSEKGIVLSPPNLPGWDNVPVKAMCEKYFGVKTVLCNDADACAVAEWKFGAGKNCRNLVFLTFGTGMGAGLILNGKLYSGTNNSAGEIGHIRLVDNGPSGYGKNGSFEGFCSGGGILRSAVFYEQECKKNGMKSELFGRLSDLSAKEITEAALNGDEFALFVMNNCAEKLGLALSFIIDILNPEKIIIGSIYSRNREFFDSRILPVIKKEALERPLSVCSIVPAALGENIGDCAALSLALL